MTRTEAVVDAFVDLVRRTDTWPEVAALVAVGAMGLCFVGLCGLLFLGILGFLP